ncbi:VOC family protein [Spirochaeta africana]|uniref:VOC family protein n=1 Tax=Spirochaeta africana TaxID=46355 RepID=UPI003CCB30F6
MCRRRCSGHLRRLQHPRRSRNLAQAAAGTALTESQRCTVWAHLKVADLDRALEFWCGILGFTLTQRYGTQAEWPRTREGELAMTTRPLDLESLLAAADQD